MKGHTLPERKRVKCDQFYFPLIFSGIPEAENFAFSFNTLLSDVALYCPTYREEIFEAQTNLLITLCKILEESKAQQGPLAANTRREFD